MTTQHTPTPWQVELRNAGAAIVAPAASGKMHEATVICSGLGGNRANAAFIVRACNAHDELVAALTLAKYVLATLSLDDDCTEGQPEALAAARAALAKVQP